MGRWGLRIPGGYSKTSPHHDSFTSTFFSYSNPAAGLCQERPLVLVSKQFMRRDDWSKCRRSFGPSDFQILWNPLDRLKSCYNILSWGLRQVFFPKSLAHQTKYLSFKPPKCWAMIVFIMCIWCETLVRDFSRLPLILYLSHPSQTVRTPVYRFCRVFFPPTSSLVFYFCYRAQWSFTNMQNVHKPVFFFFSWQTPGCLSLMLQTLP